MATVKCAQTTCPSKTAGIANTEVLADTVLCLDCGGFTDMHGRALPGRPQFTAPSFQERKARGEVQ